MRKLISVMLILAALFVTGCGKKEEKQEVKTDAPEVKQEQKAEVKEEQKPEPKEQQTEKQEQPEQQSQPVQIEIESEDLEEMINKFNELEDGDPEKEEIRTKLEQIFASAE